MLPTKFRWYPCLLTDRDEMSNLHRGHSIDASYHVSVHLAKWFQRRRILKIGQSETRIVCGGHTCQVTRFRRVTPGNRACHPHFPEHPSGHGFH
jgi:hypothetical protein